MTTNENPLANKIKSLRQDRKLSQGDLARLVGCPQSRISEIEHGHVRFPRYDRLVAIARALGTPLEELAG